MNPTAAGILLAQALRSTLFFLEAILMIEPPKRHSTPLRAAGSYQVRSTRFGNGRGPGGKKTDSDMLPLQVESRSDPDWRCSQRQKAPKEKKDKKETNSKKNESFFLTLAVTSQCRTYLAAMLVRSWPRRPAEDEGPSGCS
jgi:hypothetical protein